MNSETAQIWHQIRGLLRVSSLASNLQSFSLVWLQQCSASTNVHWRYNDRKMIMYSVSQQLIYGFMLLKSEISSENIVVTKLSSINNNKGINALDWIKQKKSSIKITNINYWFNFSIFAMSAIVGSVVSVFLTAALLWAILSIALKRFSLIDNRDVILIACIFLLYPAAEIVSILVNDRGWAGLSAAAGSLLFLAVLPVASRLAQSPPQDIINSVGRGAAAGAILAAVYSGGQIVFVGGRSEAGFGNASILAACSLVGACICLTLLSQVSRRFRNFLIAGIFCSLACVAFAGTRAVWLAAPFCLGIAAIPMFWFKEQLVFGTRGLIFATMAGATLPFCASIVIDRFKAMLATMQLSANLAFDESIDVRLAMYRGAWEQVKASPLFGYGPDSSTEMLLALGGAVPFQFTHYHNFLLTSLVRGGIFAFLSLIAVFWVLFWFVFRTSQNRYQFAGRILICSCLFAFGLPAMTGVLFTHDILNALFVYVMIIGICLSISKEAQPAASVGAAQLSLGPPQ